MKKITKIFNLLIIFQLITCTSCNKYITPNNHDYNQINHNHKLINNDQKLQLIINNRFSIPNISTTFKEPIKDFTPPHYEKEKFHIQTKNTSTTKSNLNKKYIENKIELDHKTNLDPQSSDQSTKNNITNSEENNKVNNTTDSSNNKNDNDADNDSNYKENDFDLNLEEID